MGLEDPKVPHHQGTNWSECAAVERHINVVSGAWVFRGTRVPIRALFENLRDGASIEGVLEWFPGVTRDHVEATWDFSSIEILSRLDV
jgi:uncharacterized protein (DUF433 family)